MRSTSAPGDTGVVRPHVSAGMRGRDARCVRSRLALAKKRLRSEGGYSMGAAVRSSGNRGQVSQRVQGGATVRTSPCCAVARMSTTS